MSQPETRLQVAIEKALRDAGVYCRRQRLEGRKGWPDLYLIFGCCGKAAHLEVKMPGRSAEPLQVATLYELEDAGAATGIVTSVEEALDFVRGHRCP